MSIITDLMSLIAHRQRLEDAACRNYPPSFWETNNYTQPPTQANRDAMDICRLECPAATRERCLAGALEYEKGMGAGGRWLIYGGLMPRQRAELDKTGGAA